MGFLCQTHSNFGLNAQKSAACYRLLLNGMENMAEAIIIIRSQCFESIDSHSHQRRIHLHSTSTCVTEAFQNISPTFNRHSWRMSINKHQLTSLGVCLRVILTSTDPKCACLFPSYLAHSHHQMCHFRFVCSDFVTFSANSFSKYQPFIFGSRFSIYAPKCREQNQIYCPSTIWNGIGCRRRRRPLSSVPWLWLFYSF